MQFVTNIAHILFIIKLNFIEIEKRGSLNIINIKLSYKTTFIHIHCVSLINKYKTQHMHSKSLRVSSILSIIFYLIIVILLDIQTQSKDFHP